MHCSTLAGHLGMWKTIEALQRRVWWPGMAQDVRCFIAGCLACLQLKDQTSLPPGSLAPIPLPLDYFSFWTMDFITSLPEDQGSNAIFTCIDKLTKLVRLTHCHMGEGLLSAEQTAKLFYDNVVRLFGVPNTILHDRDVQFTTKFWTAFFELIVSKVLFTLAYHL